MNGDRRRGENCGHRNSCRFQLRWRTESGDFRDIAGNLIRGLDQFHVELRPRVFKYKFIQPEDLRPNERRVYARTRAIFDSARGKPSSVRGWWRSRKP